MKVSINVNPRKNPYLPVEAEGILPANFVSGSPEIMVWEGNKERHLSDLATITVEGEVSEAADITLALSGETALFKRVGEYMEEGTITVEGDIGMHCGNFMSGGLIEILGNAGGWLGREMKGGSILCHGDAGVYCGSGYRGEKHGMRGGKIEILGNAGDFCAEALSGGEVIVRGSCGDMAGVEMQDGKLIIYGDCSRACGNMTGGVATIFGSVSGMLPTFRNEGEVVVDGHTLIQFTGDVANRGKGTLRVAAYTCL